MKPFLKDSYFHALFESVKIDETSKNDKEIESMLLQKTFHSIVSLKSCEIFKRRLKGFLIEILSMQIGKV